MSKALYDKAGLRFWSEEELIERDYIRDSTANAVKSFLLGINPAWNFIRHESPMLIPTSTISNSYTANDIFMTSGGFALRPETTNGSFLVADQVLKTSKIKPPLCVWQMGKSYRVEASDGASASNYRYNEFTQLEFQCIYSLNTMADYRAMGLIEMLKGHFSRLMGVECRSLESDRLPTYSTLTEDIEAFCQRKGKHIEIASVSDRTDFRDGEYRCLEIAIGVDRVIDIGK